MWKLIANARVSSLLIMFVENPGWLVEVVVKITYRIRNTWWRASDQENAFEEVQGESFLKKISQLRGGISLRTWIFFDIEFNWGITQPCGWIEPSMTQISRYINLFDWNFRLDCSSEKINRSIYAWFQRVLPPRRSSRWDFRQIVPLPSWPTSWPLQLRSTLITSNEPLKIILHVAGGCALLRICPSTNPQQNY